MSLFSVLYAMASRDVEDKHFSAVPLASPAALDLAADSFDFRRAGRVI